MDDILIEKWLIIDLNTNYSISNLGRVKNNKTNYILKYIINAEGYGQVKILSNKNIYVHILVARMFLNHKTDGTVKKVINHIDGIKLNNKVNNLEIVTNRENCSICFKKNKEKQTSEYVGVCWVKKNKKWCSKIRILNKRYYLGYFNNEVDAYNMYKEALYQYENENFNDWYLTIGISPNKTSKYKGVHFNKRIKKWVSEFQHNNIRYIDTFNDEFEAYQNYLTKKDLVVSTLK